MGINEAIARVRDGVRQRTTELGEQLHSEAIPARLRPAAERLAAFLRVAPASRSEELPPVLDEVLAAPGAVTLPSIDAAALAQAIAETPEAPAPAEEPAAPEEDKRALRRAAIARAAESRSRAELRASTKARPAPAPAAPSDSATRAKPQKPAAPPKKESAKGVAAKPGSANSSARRDAKPASKRPNAKAPRKK
jgi:hypothetical protein